MAERRDHQVTRLIGILVEQDEGLPAPDEDVGRGVVADLGGAAEHAAAAGRRRFARRPLSRAR